MDDVKDICLHQNKNNNNQKAMESFTVLMLEIGSIKFHAQWRCIFCF